MQVLAAVVFMWIRAARTLSGLYTEAVLREEEAIAAADAS